MNSIEIYIDCLGNHTNILIDIPKKKININNQEKEITEEKICELLRIIRTWNSNYPKSNHMLDGEKFLIKINTNEKADIIKGNGTYPENYASFKTWIGEFYD